MYGGESSSHNQSSIIWVKQVFFEQLKSCLIFLKYLLLHNVGFTPCKQGFNSLATTPRSNVPLTYRETCLAQSMWMPRVVSMNWVSSSTKYLRFAWVIIKYIICRSPHLIFRLSDVEIDLHFNISRTKTREDGLEDNVGDEGLHEFLLNLWRIESKLFS